MAYTITRLLDGATLPQLPQTRLQVNPDAFGSARSQITSLGLLGEAVQMASNLEIKQFSLTWISTDKTGQEQHQLRKFFSSPEPYEISSTEFGISKIWATVSSREPDGWVSTTFHFTSRFGEFLTENTALLTEQIRTTGGASTAWSGSYTNSTSAPAILQLTLEAASGSAVWSAGTEVLLTGIPFVIGAQDEFGRWNLTQKRKSIIVDSMRLIKGSGYFKPAASQFFSIRPGQTKAISLPSIPMPFPTNAAWTLRLEAISRAVEA